MLKLRLIIPFLWTTTKNCFFSSSILCLSEWCLPLLNIQVRNPRGFFLIVSIPSITRPAIYTFWIALEVIGHFLLPAVPLHQSRPLNNNCLSIFYFQPRSPLIQTPYHSLTYISAFQIWLYHCGALICDFIPLGFSPRCWTWDISQDWDPASPMTIISLTLPLALDYSLQPTRDFSAAPLCIRPGLCMFFPCL